MMTLEKLLSFYIRSDRLGYTARISRPIVARHVVVCPEYGSCV